MYITRWLARLVEGDPDQQEASLQAAEPLLDPIYNIIYYNILLLLLLLLLIIIIITHILLVIIIIVIV